MKGVWEKNESNVGKLFSYSNPYFCLQCGDYNIREACAPKKDSSPCSVMEILTDSNNIFKLYDTRGKFLPGNRSFVEISLPKGCPYAEVDLDSEAKRAAMNLAKEVGIKDLAFPESKPNVNARLVYQNGAIERLGYDRMNWNDAFNTIARLPVPNVKNHPTSEDLGFPVHLVDEKDFVKEYNPFVDSIKETVKREGSPSKF